MDRRFLPFVLAFFLMLAPLAAAQDEAPADNTTNETNQTPDAAGDDVDPTEGEAAEPEPEPPANETPPAPQAPTEYVLEAHAEGSSFWFNIQGETERNPTLYVAPNSEITITVIGVSGVHNIQVDGHDASPFVQPGETITYTFTSPETGTLQYWCPVHSATMRGIAQVGLPTTQPPGERPEIQGPTVDLGTLGYPDCAGFLIPRSTAEGEVGGPTVEDYVQQCREGGGGPTVQQDDSHPADLIIPVTWLLIGLGVVGVVWVNRYYKP